LGFPTTESTHSPAYSNRLVTHGTPAVAGAVAIGLSGVYLTIKHHEEAVAEMRSDSLAAEEPQPNGAGSGAESQEVEND
jgi:hypothetical protein